MKEINKYGVDMSKNKAYYTQKTCYDIKYVLRKTFKACGCCITDDCCCGDDEGVFLGFENSNDNIMESKVEGKRNRRLLLIKKR